MLQRLIQRAGIAKREDVARGLAARPGDGALFDGQAQGDLKTGLDPGADNFAVALGCMGIAQKEQRSGGRDGEPHRGLRAKAAVVHIAAVLARCGGRDRLTQGRGHAKAADHRGQRQG